jgi:parallel beta-helix repeat protein
MKRILWMFIYILSNGALSAQYNFILPEHFRTTRNLPLLDFPVTTEVKVADFGAVPNDGKDDGPAIRKAIEFAKKVGQTGTGVLVTLQKGRYDLFEGENKFHLIQLNKASNIIMDGNGSEIIIHNPLKGFLSVWESNNIIIKNMYIDYDPLPFTQGKVVGVNIEENTFDLKLDAGFPTLNMPMFQEASRVWGMLMDPNIPGKLKDGAPNYYASKKFKEIEPGVFRITLPGPRLLRFVEIGDSYVHVARTNGSTIFKSVSSKNITYLNNTSYTSPAGSYAANNMEEWNIIGCEVKLKEGRIHSANADCMHINGGKFGPWIENSLFEGYGDDAVNIKATKRHILKQISPTELIVKWQTVEGDVLKIYNPREGKLIGVFTVVKNKFLGDQKMRITLDKPIETELNVGDSKLNDIAYLDNLSNESFVIRNNTFRNARRYGILVQASYGLIERNVFDNLSQNGISLINGVDWGEGFIANNIVINQNIFNNCGYDDTYLNDEDVATIFIKIVKLKNPEAKTIWKGVATTDWQGIENITITNNIFSYNKRAISVECSKNTVIKGNRFVKNSTDLTTGGEVFREYNNTNLIVEDLPSNN